MSGAARLRPRESPARDFPQPLWLGDDDIAGKTILLHSEQGFGDTIQFCRYAPLVAARGARVVVEVEEPLLRAYERSCRHGAGHRQGQPAARFRFPVPASQPAAGIQDEARNDSLESSYLRAPKQACWNWNIRLGARRRPRIGLAWAGNPKHVRDRERSIGLRHLLPLLDVDATFVSLQKDVRAADTEMLEKSRENPQFWRRAARFFRHGGADITTRSRHIGRYQHRASGGRIGQAGLGIVDACPRLALAARAGTTAPGIPPARLFRQSDSREWDGVIARVRDALLKFAESDG